MVSNIEEQTLEILPLPEPLSSQHASSRLTTQCIEYSVGVMAYNEEANIGRTLDAILNQTHSRASVK